jgi:hypothetical protein
VLELFGCERLLEDHKPLRHPGPSYQSHMLRSMRAGANLLLEEGQRGLDIRATEVGRFCEHATRHDEYQRAHSNRCECKSRAGAILYTVWPLSRGSARVVARGPKPCPLGPLPGLGSSVAALAGGDDNAEARDVRRRVVRGTGIAAVGRKLAAQAGTWTVLCTFRLSNLYGKSVTKNSLRSQPEPGPRPD